MKAKCEKCERTIEGQGHNVSMVCDGVEGWIAFMDVSSGLSVYALCPDHSPQLVQAAQLLTDLFGEKRMSAIHLGGILKKSVRKSP